MEEVTRIVHCADAISWLKENPLTNCSLIASLPDISEFPKYTLLEWKAWFISTSELVLEATPSQGVTIFYQTDIKVDGAWIDKAYLCQKAAEKLNHSLLWHKIICRSPAGTTTFGRPSYSHIVCFSKELKADAARSTPDVLPVMGEKTWERGMGMEACQMIAKFIKSQTPTKTLVHPFCGEGAMLAVANQEGLSAIGIEKSAKRAEKARKIRVNDDQDQWIL